jgi:UTP pyrophosphatase
MGPVMISGYLAGYPADLTEQVRGLIAAGRIGGILRGKYPRAHTVRSDKALYDYVQALKSDHLRNASPLSRVAFDGKLQEVRNALGTHTRISRVQGGKLKAKREIHVAAVFKDMPEDFLRMIVVHELAHLKEPDHGKAFYQLCCHLERDYHQIEFDVRVYLSYLEAGGDPLWSATMPI